MLGRYRWLLHQLQRNADLAGKPIVIKVRIGIKADGWRRLSVRPATQTSNGLRSRFSALT